MRRLNFSIFALALAACGDDATGGGAAETRDIASDVADTSSADVPAETVAPDTTPPDTTPVDTAPADSIAPDTTPADTTPAEIADTAPGDTTPADTADTTPVDTTPADTADTMADPAACEVPTMKQVYPGPFPPFPYGDWGKAEGCVADPHDVVIVLGCPSEDDGAPSNCQIQRAIITEQLYDAGWADHFITTGGAVHNSHVEADALHALLVQRGIPADAIIKEPKARHTDENLYYSTRIMEAEGWTSALVVSEDPGHLMMTALCDSNCCVDLGRLTLYQWEVADGLTVKAGHYALTPPGAANTDADCQHISGLFMCINLADRDACKDDFQLAE